MLCLLFIHPRVPNLIDLRSYQHHAGMISSLVPALISAFKVRRELALEKRPLFGSSSPSSHHSVKRAAGFWCRVNPLVC